MTFIPIAVLAALAAAQPVLAEEAASATTAEAPAATAEAPAATAGVTAANAAFTVEMPIDTLMADERSKAVLDAHLPEIGQHPAYEQFKAMSLVQVMPWSQGLITEDLLATISKDLAEIEAAPAA